MIPMKVEENITWEQSRAITEELLLRLCPPNDETIPSLDNKNAVYIVTYEGSELAASPWDSSQLKVVYVGISKPNSSRHFCSGETGTSTLRRSLAALLEVVLSLIPIPRSADPVDGDRYNNYMLDPDGEKQLTEWIKENFRIALLEVEGDPDPLYRALIEYNVPMFNFQHNPANKYGAEIKLHRRRMAETARKNEAEKAG